MVKQSEIWVRDYRLQSQAIFSKAFQTAWREPFDFATGISDFPM